MIVEEKMSIAYVCPKDPRATLCMGSRCMAWRWVDERNPEWVPTVSFGIPQKHPDDLPSPYRKSTTHGYCGLAGRP